MTDPLRDPKANMAIERASVDDLPELWRLFRMVHAEGGMFPFDDDLVHEFFDGALNGKQGIIGVIRGPAPEIRAMTFLLISRQWYTTKWHLEELLNFVDPKFRKSYYADALIRFCQYAAKELNIPLMIGVLANHRTEAKVRLYRRRLGMPAGAFFVDNTEWMKERATTFDTWKERRKRGKKDKPVDWNEMRSVP